MNTNLAHALPLQWTGDEVKIRLLEAFRTLGRMSGGHGRPPALAELELDFVRAAVEAYGYDDARVYLGPPTARAITRMDEVLAWLLWLAAEERVVISARCCGLKWRAVERITGKSDRYLRGVFMDAITKILRELNRP